MDFWATWCGPCIAELPNVNLPAYELYKDKGFDVVGISLDTEREKLEKFLAEQKLPWISILPEDKAGWDHPMATYYGVMGIPTVILVDKEGKVVPLNVRGDQLRTEYLTRLLGPVEDKPEPPQEEKKSDSYTHCAAGSYFSQQGRQTSRPALLVRIIRALHGFPPKRLCLSNRRTTAGSWCEPIFRSLFRRSSSVTLRYGLERYWLAPLHLQPCVISLYFSKKL